MSTTQNCTCIEANDPNCPLHGYGEDGYTTQDTQTPQQPQWEITGHNGIGEYDEAKGDVTVDKNFAKRMHVVSIETDEAYIEFSVEKQNAGQLKDYLNTLEAKAKLVGDLRGILAAVAESQSRPVNPHAIPLSLRVFAAGLVSMIDGCDTSSPTDV